MDAPAPQLTEDMVRSVILTWYHGTNEHLPMERVELLLSEDVEMRYPNRAEPFVGKAAFRAWYADVLAEYFDETHVVESSRIAIDGARAEAEVIVRWEARSWKTGEARSQYLAHLSRQRFRIVRHPGGRVEIAAKIVETFEPAAPVYGVGT